jgi:hypothetical protein
MTIERVQVIRGLAAAAVALVFAVAVILLLPGEPCMEWQGWRYVKIWPRPEHC